MNLAATSHGAKRRIRARYLKALDVAIISQRERFSESACRSRKWYGCEEFGIASVHR